MTHHCAAQQQGRVISAVCLQARNRNTAASAAADGHICRPLIAVSDAHLAKHGMCHQNISAVKEQTATNYLQKKGGGRRNEKGICDECSPDCVWRKRSQGLSSVSLVKIMM